MTRLIITRGLPGSGKSTLAKDWVASDPTSRARINRDDLRAQLHGGYVQQEAQITAVRNAAIGALLRRGVDVVCDDTNLPNGVVRDLHAVAARAGAELEVWDLTHVPVDECIRRDAGRDHPVGEHVIRQMFDRYLDGRSIPLPLPEAVAART